MPDAPSTPSDIYPSLFYRDANAAIDWLCRAFGFRRRFVVPGPDGAVVHSELSLGTGVVMIGSLKLDSSYCSPTDLAGLHQILSVHVADPDAHYARALAEGATITQELRDEDYGSRGYMARDPEGHEWYFGTYRPGAYWDADPTDG
jgi:uncharacterized glyoxalase superfamily protein PhnB